MDAPPEAGIVVWDRFVRVFHWSLVACVGACYFALAGGDRPHELAGWAALALVLARCVWGFIGSTHARFASFLPTPARVREHLGHLRARHAGVGHNPLGALMMLLLMALVVALALTGWMQDLDAFFGEEWLMDRHEWLAHALIASAAMHAAAALLMSWWERSNLVGAMFTGRKRRC